MQTTTLTPARPDTSMAASPPARLVDPEQLICPGCGEQVACAPPGYWQVSDGLPVPQFSHRDATALCGVADPVEVDVIEVER